MTEVDELLARLRKLPAVQLDADFKASVRARAPEGPAGSAPDAVRLAGGCRNGRAVLGLGVAVCQRVVSLKKSASAELSEARLERPGCRIGAGDVHQLTHRPSRPGC